MKIRPSDVGRRVTVQYFAADGERQEAVGQLERAEQVDGDVVFHIRKRDDTVVKVPITRIKHGKVVR